jgi:hypothetical protein
MRRAARRPVSGTSPTGTGTWSTTARRLAFARFDLVALGNYDGRLCGGDRGKGTTRGQVPSRGSRRCYILRVSNVERQAGLLQQAIDEVLGAVLIPLVGSSRVNEDHVDPRRLELLLQLEAQDGRVRRVLRGIADLRVLLPAVKQADRRVVLADVLDGRILLNSLQDLVPLVDQALEIRQADGVGTVAVVGHPCAQLLRVAAALAIAT